MHDWDALKRAVASHTEESPTGSVQVLVERGGEKLTIEVSPLGHPAKMMVGPYSFHASVGIGRAVAVGAVTPGKLLASTVRAVLRMFTATEKPELTGPVGIVKATADAEREGVVPAFTMAALLVSYFLSYVVAFSVVIALTSLRKRRSAA
jgi:hypothetical protein